MIRPSVQTPSTSLTMSRMSIAWGTAANGDILGPASQAQVMAVSQRLSVIIVLLFAPLVFAQSADVSVLKTASPEPVQSGGMLTYSIAVNNEGPDSAASVTLSDSLPPGVLFQSISANAGWSCTTPAIGSNGAISCSTASFAVGGVDFTVVTTVAPSVKDGTVLANVATVSSTTTDPHSNNNTSEADSTVAAAPAPTLDITKAGA